jgi:hypothetical protein
MASRLKHILLAAAVAAAATLPSPAQAATAQDYVGRWTGQTDWRGIDGFDSDGSWWDFASDGTFVDNGDERGTWSVDSDGYINFAYAGGGQSHYYGTIVGGTLLGTMTNGSANGVFALRR